MLIFCEKTNRICKGANPRFKDTKLYEGGRRELTIGLRTLNLFKEGRGELTLGLRMLTLDLRILI